MGNVTAALVKELREKTGAGMMDCKKALVETNGDMEQAVVYLREKGLSKAVKKAGRIASEGIVDIVISNDGKRASLLEVNSETDFVAKNEEFTSFVNKLTKLILEEKPADVEALKDLNYPEENKKVSEVLTEKIAKIGENITIRRFAVLEMAKGGVFAYKHGNGKIGVLVSLESEATVDSLKELEKDIAMQSASMNPKYIYREDVDSEYIEKEREILLNQAVNENQEDVKNGKKGKPQEIIEKMVEGRLNKELKETCLVEQVFIKNSDFTVKQYIENKAEEIGSSVKLINAVRYEVGEGMEKKEENFAEEVAKQIGK